MSLLDPGILKPGPPSPPPPPDPATCELRPLDLRELEPTSDDDPSVFESVMVTLALRGVPRVEGVPNRWLWSDVVLGLCSDGESVGARFLGDRDPPDFAGQVCRVIVKMVAEARAELHRQRVEDEEYEIIEQLRPRASVPVEQPWIIDGILPARASSLLVSKSGHGKNWAQAYACIAVASGAPFLERRVERGRALWLCLESRDINERHLRHLARSIGYPIEALDDWIDFWPFDKPFKSDDPACMAELARYVRLRQYALITVDNADEIRTPQFKGAEDDSTITGAVMRPLAQLAQHGMINGERVTDRPLAIVTSKHAGRNGALRGSTAYEQHADFVVELRRLRPKDPESVLTLGLGEGTRVASALPLSMRFRGIMPGAVVPELVTERDASEPGPRADRLDRMYKLICAEPGLGTNALARKVGGSKRDAIADLKELEADELIERRDALFYPSQDEE